MSTSARKRNAAVAVGSRRVRTAGPAFRGAEGAILGKSSGVSSKEQASKVIDQFLGRRSTDPSV